MLFAVIAGCSSSASIPSETDTQTESFQHGSDVCTAGETVCVADTVHRCENGVFELWDDCDAQRLACVMIKGTAECTEITINDVDVDTDNDNDTNTDTESESEINTDLDTDAHTDTDTDSDIDSDTDADSETETYIDTTSEISIDTDIEQDTNDSGCSANAYTTDADGNVLIDAADKHNYTFSSHLNIESISVRAMSDLTFDWSALSHDIMGHEFGPDQISFSLWHYNENAILADISKDSLDIDELVVLLQAPVTYPETSATLFDLLSPSGDAIDDDDVLAFTDPATYPPDEYTYLFTLNSGMDLGRNTKSLAFVSFVPKLSNTQVPITDNTTQLNYSVDIVSATPISVPKGVPNIIIDWNNTDILTKTAMGTN